MRRLLAMSCEMMTEVSPKVRCVRWMRPSTNSIITGSRPVVGSSNNTTSGLLTTARASATRFFIPPDRLAGSSSMAPGISSISSSSTTRRRTSARFIEVFCSSGKPMFSATVIESMRA